MPTFCLIHQPIFMSFFRHLNTLMSDDTTATEDEIKKIDDAAVSLLILELALRYAYVIIIRTCMCT